MEPALHSLIHRLPHSVIQQTPSTSSLSGPHRHRGVRPGPARRVFVPLGRADQNTETQKQQDRPHPPPRPRATPAALDADAQTARGGETNPIPDSRGSQPVAEASKHTEQQGTPCVRRSGRGRAGQRRATRTHRPPERRGRSYRVQSGKAPLGVPGTGNRGAWDTGPFPATRRPEWLESQGGREPKSWVPSCCRERWKQEGNSIGTVRFRRRSLAAV